MIPPTMIPPTIAALLAYAQGRQDDAKEVDANFVAASQTDPFWVEPRDQVIAAQATLAAWTHITACLPACLTGTDIPSDLAAAAAFLQQGLDQARLLTRGTPMQPFLARKVTIATYQDAIRHLENPLTV